MPNWCDNYLEIKGDKETLVKFYETVNKKMVASQKRFEKIPEKERFGLLSDKDWTRNLYAKASMKVIKDRGWNVRGHIHEFEMDVPCEIIVIMCDIAWGGFIDGFSQYLNEFYPELYISYATESECGMGIYNQYSNHPEKLDKRVYVDIEDEDIYEDCYENEVLPDINKQLGTDFKSVEELEKYCEDKDYSYSIHVYNNVAI